MNDTENYVSRLRSTMHGRLAFSFAVNSCGAVLAFLAAFLIFGKISCGNYMIACDVSGGGFINTVKSAVVSQAPCAVLLLLMYASAFSSLCGPASVLLCVWRGLCLGSSVSLISSSRVGGIGSGWKLSIILYFAATVGIIALASVSSIYSRALAYSFSSDDRKYFRALSAEYTKCFLTVSGAVFVFGCASAVFI